MTLVEKILEILEFLGLNWDEGPNVGGKYGPYIQSERKDLYKKGTVRYGAIVATNQRLALIRKDDAA